VTVERKISFATEIVDICDQVKSSSWVWLAKVLAQQQAYSPASEAY